MTNSVAIEKRLLEDTLGATVGAAVGAGLVVAVSAALPVVLSFVPFAALGGTILGILTKELAQQRQRTQTK
jgi:hypothetical protein